ncbi:MAG: Fe-S cluster assembly protein SufD [Gemmatimonadales bacterium]
MGATAAPVAPGESRGVAGSLVELAANSEFGTGPDWLVALRQAGLDRFAEVGIPTSKNEEWRFTPVGPIGTLEWKAAGESAVVRAEDIAPYLFGKNDWPLLVIVDGVVDKSLSSLQLLTGGATFGSLAGAIAAGRPEVEAHLGRHASPDVTPFSALNAAVIADGAFLHVPADVVLPTPVQVLHVVTRGAHDAVVSPRVLAVLDRGARASIIESFVTLADTPYFTNTCSESVLGENAWLEYVRVQREGSKAWHIGLSRVDQDRDSHYRSFTLNMGGKLARHDLHTKLNAPNIETLLYGLYLTKGEQLVDNHTAIFHDHPNCNSWEVYKGVLAEKSRAVFNGKVLVKPEAQKTDAKQTNRNLLLSNDAKVNTKPQLEIFADDVKCTHGATIGKLDEQQRYYMATRGIGGKTAQALLIWAFAAEVLMEVSVAPVREALEGVVRRQLDALIA